MTDISMLSQASAHIQTARELGNKLSSRKSFTIFGQGRITEQLDRIIDELAAAIDLVASAVSAENRRASEIEAQNRLLDQSVERLELVTAGDEQLIDDLGAAIEMAQIELVRLERQHDLLRSRLESNQ
ncbi:MAG: hypothetical protein ACJZ57_02555 [Candidatus Poriferisodalaceae bacterium]